MAGQPIYFFLKSGDVVLLAFQHKKKSNFSLIGKRKIYVGIQ